MKMKTTFALALLFLFGCNNKKDNNDPQEKPATPRDSVISTNNGAAFNSLVPVDISPMDMSYYPADYPKLIMGKTAASPPLARVIYSRPHLQGRHVFHEVLKYGENWRLGANESTELELYTDAQVQGKSIKAGRYILYCIPQPTEWKIILNSHTHSWGLQPDPSKDVVSFNVPVVTTSSAIEYFTMVFEQTGTGADLLMAWDNVEVRLPFQF
jgi:hypothetical protein